MSVSGCNLELEVIVHGLKIWTQFGNHTNNHFVLCQHHCLLLFLESVVHPMIQISFLLLSNRRILHPTPPSIFIIIFEEAEASNLAVIVVDVN
jgi:hypothetical protein